MKFTVAPYSPAWPQQFEKQAAIIRRAIGDLQPRIDHIGSTSVPNLAAKPIIDILVGVTEDAHLPMVVKPMQDAGYTYFKIYEPDMPYRRFFAKLRPLTDLMPPAIVEEAADIDRAKFENQVHIHIIPQASEHWLRHIAFRDYLRTHADAREAYGELKKDISQREFKDMLEYNEAKDSFVKEMERRAVEWYRR